MGRKIEISIQKLKDSRFKVELPDGTYANYSATAPISYIWDLIELLERAKKLKKC